MRGCSILALGVALCCGVGCDSSTDPAATATGKTPSKIHEPDAGSDGKRRHDECRRRRRRRRRGQRSGRWRERRARRRQRQRHGRRQRWWWRRRRRCRRQRHERRKRRPTGEQAAGGVARRARRRDLRRARCLPGRVGVARADRSARTARRASAAQLRATDFAYLDQAVTDGRVLYDPVHVAGVHGRRFARSGATCSRTACRRPCVDVLEGNVAQRRRVRDQRRVRGRGVLRRRATSVRATAPRCSAKATRAAATTSAATT